MNAPASAAFRSIAVVGAGAVGSWFGAMLAKAGQAVMLIGRPAHATAIARDGLALGEPWRKLVVNCAYDAISALTREAVEDPSCGGTRQWPCWWSPGTRGWPNNDPPLLAWRDCGRRAVRLGT